MLLRLPRTKNIYYLISFAIGSILYYSFFNNDYLGKNDFKTNINNLFFDDAFQTNNTIEPGVKPLINLTTTTVTSTLSSSTTLTNSNSSTTITSTSTTLSTSINSTSVASTTLTHLNTSIITTITSTSTTLITSINSFSTSVESATLATSPQLNINESCPLIPPNLGTRIEVDKTDSSLKEIEQKLKDLPINTGGLSFPKECKARFKVAIIVPYRNRETNLKIFLRHMHPFLIKQQLDYGIYLIEPIQNITFNRGLLMNIGFLESLKLTSNKWDCFVFHDVDLIPEDERNIYSCPELPRHMSSAVSTFGYKLPYDGIFGGVSALTKKQMETVNGYSNLYFGWGGEDDDFRLRIVSSGYTVSRYPLEIGRYLMAKHSKDTDVNADRFKLLGKAKTRIKYEGLNSIKYTIAQVEKALLYTRIIVVYNKKELIPKIT